MRSKSIPVLIILISLVACSNYQEFLKWLQNGGAIINGLVIHEFPGTGRGLRTTKNINKGEELLFIPNNLLITDETSYWNSKLNREMKRRNIKGSEFTHIANFLYEEFNKIGKQKVFFEPYLKTLPQSFQQFPYFLPESTLAQINYTSTYDDIISRKQMFQEEYNTNKQAFTAELSYSYEEFLKLRVLVQSRSFEVRINDGQRLSVLSPFADLFNHNSQVDHTHYFYDDQRKGFIFQATDRIKKGNQEFSPYIKQLDSEVFFRYSNGTNKYLYLFYGFTEADLLKNQFNFNYCLNKSDHLYQIKKSIWKEDCYKSRLTAERKFSILQAYSFMDQFHAFRLFSINRFDKIVKFESRNKKFNGKNVKLMSFAMEREAIEYMSQFLREKRRKYGEDLSSIGNADLEIIVRREREILDYHIKQLDLMSELIEMPLYGLEYGFEERRFDDLREYVGELIRLRRI